MQTDDNKPNAANGVANNDNATADDDDDDDEEEEEEENEEPIDLAQVWLPQQSIRVV